MHSPVSLNSTYYIVSVSPSRSRPPFSDVNASRPSNRVAVAMAAARRCCRGRHCCCQPHRTCTKASSYPAKGSRCRRRRRHCLTCYTRRTHNVVRGYKETKCGIYEEIERASERASGRAGGRANERRGYRLPSFPPSFLLRGSGSGHGGNGSVTSSSGQLHHEVVQQLYNRLVGWLLLLLLAAVVAFSSCDGKTEREDEVGT